MEDFWLGTTAAATVATAIATGFTLWLRQRDRPEVYWHIVGRESRKPDQSNEWHRDVFTLVNAGDGVGYRVEMTASPGHSERLDREHGHSDSAIAVARPGDSFRFVVRHDGVPKNVLLRISWVPEPTRLNRPVTELIPLAEGLQAAVTGQRSGPSDWRRRELRWWQLGQRYQQAAARRARTRHQVGESQARKAMWEWRENASRERVENESKE